MFTGVELMFPVCEHKFPDRKLMFHVRKHKMSSSPKLFLVSTAFLPRLLRTKESSEPPSAAPDWQSGRALSFQKLGSALPVLMLHLLALAIFDHLAFCHAGIPHRLQVDAINSFLKYHFH